MRDNRKDTTIWRNYIEKYRFLITEYELVKKKQHTKYRLAKDFYAAHDTCGKSFLKYYNRFKQSGRSSDLLPQKRGPKYKTRRPLPFIENKVVALRLKGNNKHEIVTFLNHLYGKTPPHLQVYITSVNATASPDSSPRPKQRSAGSLKNVWDNSDTSTATT